MNAFWSAAVGPIIGGVVAVVFGGALLGPRRTWHLRWLKQEVAVYSALPDGDAKEAMGDLIDLNTYRYIKTVSSWREIDRRQLLSRAGQVATVVAAIAAGVYGLTRAADKTPDNLVTIQIASALAVIGVLGGINGGLSRRRIDREKERREMDEFFDNAQRLRNAHAHNAAWAARAWGRDAAQNPTAEANPKSDEDDDGGDHVGVKP